MDAATTADDEQYMQDSEEVSELIYEEVFPFLSHLEDEYPEQGAFFTAFIDIMHVLFYQGWTEEDLRREVTDHYALFLKNECEDRDPSELQ
jgi:predicted GNAT superfamily acetyltransferase